MRPSHGRVSRSLRARASGASMSKRSRLRRLAHREGLRWRASRGEKNGLLSRLLRVSRRTRMLAEMYASEARTACEKAPQALQMPAVLATVYRAGFRFALASSTFLNKSCYPPPVFDPKHWIPSVFVTKGGVAQRCARNYLAEQAPFREAKSGLPIPPQKKIQNFR